MRYIRIFSELSGQMRYASQKRVLLEIAFIKLTKPSMEQNLDSVLQRISELEARIAQIPSPAELAALAAAGIQLYGGVSGSADDAVQALLANSLAYNPNVRCSHHDHEHTEGHTCGSHGCGQGHCGQH